MLLTEEEVRSIVYWSIDKYKDMAEYCSSKNCTPAEFAENKAEGWIIDITAGTYNGASDTFTPWELTDRNIVEMIRRDMVETEFIAEMADIFEPAEVDTLEKQLAAYVSTYYFFTVGGRLYVSQY